jgi:hypothetical protein
VKEPEEDRQFFDALLAVLWFFCCFWNTRNGPGPVRCFDFWFVLNTQNPRFVWFCFRAGVLGRSLDSHPVYACLPKTPAAPNMESLGWGRCRAGQGRAKTKKIRSNLNSLNTFSKETGSPNVKPVLMR